MKRKKQHIHKIHYMWYIDILNELSVTWGGRGGMSWSQTRGQGDKFGQDKVLCSVFAICCPGCILWLYCRVRFVLAGKSVLTKQYYLTEIMKLLWGLQGLLWSCFMTTLSGSAAAPTQIWMLRYDFVKGLIDRRNGIRSRGCLNRDHSLLKMNRAALLSYLSAYE